MLHLQCLFFSGQLTVVFDYHVKLTSNIFQTPPKIPAQPSSKPEAWGHQTTSVSLFPGANLSLVAACRESIYRLGACFAIFSFL